MPCWCIIPLVIEFLAIYGLQIFFSSKNYRSLFKFDRYIAVRSSLFAKQLISWTYVLLFIDGSLLLQLSPLISAILSKLCFPPKLTFKSCIFPKTNYSGRVATVRENCDYQEISENFKKTGKAENVRKKDENSEKNC